MSWGGGARSIESLLGDGWYGFEIRAAVSGVVVGLNDNDTGPSRLDIRHGFYVSSGQWRVYEAGQWIPGVGGAFGGEETFRILRFQGNIYYLVGDTPTWYPGVPFELPAEVVHVSSSAFSGSVFLDSSLRDPDDDILNARLNEIPDYAYGEVAFLPLEVLAAEEDFAFAHLSFEPLEVTAEAEALFGARLSFEPLGVVASEGDYAFGEVAFAPMTVTGAEYDDQFEVVIGQAVFSPLRVIAAGDSFPEPVAELAFEPMEVQAAEDDYAEGRVSLMPLVAFAEGQSSSPTPYIFGVMPAASDVDAPVDFWDVELTQPFFALQASGLLAESNAALLDQPPSQIEAQGAWAPITLKHPGSSLEIEATNPPIGRLDAELPASEVEAAGLVGRVGRVELKHPRSRLEGISGWNVTLKQPRGRIEAVGLSGRVGIALLSQHPGVIEATATQGAVGRATLTQPGSELVQPVAVDLTQPRSVLTGAGAEDGFEEAQAAFAVNILNGAVTTYDGFAFADIVRFGDTYYAVGSDGIFELDPFADEDIEWEVHFGGGELETTAKARLTGGYALVETKAPVTAVVRTAENYEREFRLEQRDTAGLHTRRFKPARGVMARNWSVGLKGTGYVRIADVEVIGEESRRKV